MTSFPFTIIGGINGVFQPLSKVFSIDWCVFDGVDGLDNLADKQR